MPPILIEVEQPMVRDYCTLNSGAIPKAHPDYPELVYPFLP